jgi:hypothetical protein
MARERAVDIDTQQPLRLGAAERGFRIPPPREHPSNGSLKENTTPYVGPDTATGLISALTVGVIAVQGTAQFNELTSTLAILIGAFFLLFGALRMGWLPSSPRR